MLNAWRVTDNNGDAMGRFPTLRKAREYILRQTTFTPGLYDIEAWEGDDWWPRERHTGDVLRLRELMEFAAHKQAERRRSHLLHAA